MAISCLAVLAMGAALLGSLYPVPTPPYSILPYLYVGLLLSGFVWSMIWSARPVPIRIGRTGAAAAHDCDLTRQPASNA